MGGIAGRARGADGRVVDKCVLMGCMDGVRMYAYLRRSRSMLLDWVRQLSEERYRTVHPVGLGSIARTLHHVRAAEWLYMQRVRGEVKPVADVAPENDPEVEQGEALGFDALERLWAELAERTAADVARVGDWTTPRVYETVWEGEPCFYKASVGDVFAQLVLHEVHHRAQVLQMLRRMGVDTGELDYNALMWERVEGPGGA